MFGIASRGYGRIISWLKKHFMLSNRIDSFPIFKILNFQRVVALKSIPYMVFLFTLHNVFVSNGYSKSYYTELK